MRTIAVMQPYLFPYIGYFQLLKAVDIFVVFDNVNFIKRGWINRNRILSNGEDRLFTLPLLKASQNKLISEITISTAYSNWANKFLRSLNMSYSKAFFYNETMLLVESILAFESSSMSSYLVNCLKEVSLHLGISTQFELASQLNCGEVLKGGRKIQAICEAFRADRYINPIGGIELYQPSDFSQKGIQLSFLKSHEISYSQNTDQHIPWLSIIDVLMWNGKENTSQLLERYDLLSGVEEKKED